MTLAEAAASAAAMGRGMVGGLDAVSVSSAAALRVLNGPALEVRANDPRLHTFLTAPAQLQRPDIRETTFRATAAELALGFLAPNDPRRRAFRATAAETALSWRNLLNGRPIGGI